MQISDFGLAKLMPEGQEICVTARVLGTFGYFDPEYTLVRISHATVKLLNCTIESVPRQTLTVSFHLQTHHAKAHRSAKNKQQ